MSSGDLHPLGRGATPDEVAFLVMVGRALGHPLRVQLLDLLIAHGPQRRADLARRAGCATTQQLDGHLSHLVEAGLIERLRWLPRNPDDDTNPGGPSGGYAAAVDVLATASQLLGADRPPRWPLSRTS